jgi:cytochrome P450
MDTISTEPPAIDFEVFGSASAMESVGQYPVLLEHAPVFVTPNGHRVISRWEDVRQIVNQPELFSNRPNQSEGWSIPTEEASDDTKTLLAEVTRDLNLPVSLEDLMSVRMIIAADPPKHGQLRGLVNRAFVPRQMERWRPVVDGLVAELLKSVDGSASVELVDTLAAPLPINVISDVLSIKHEDRHLVRRWSDGMIGAAEGPERGTRPGLERLWGMFSEFADYFFPIMQARRTSPRDDMVSNIVRDREDATLSDADALFLILILMAGGNETTTNLIGNAVVSLLENPDQLELFLAEPELVDSVVEETLRYRSPVQYEFREATQDTELHGVRIPKGALVVPMLGAANHDPRLFDEPDRFDIRRANASFNVAFGYGIHFCVGAPLARLEARAALLALAPLLARMKLAPEPPTPVESLMLYGYSRLELVPR